jgi:quercetin dioxygenase-like cupin family protein
MTATLIIMLPLLPGKQEPWRQLCQSLQGSRRHEYSLSLQRMGIDKQEVWLSQTLQVELVQLHLHVERCEQALTALAASAHPFDRWLRKQLLDLHGLDLSQLAASAPERILVWPPARGEAAAIDAEGKHEPGRELMSLEKNPTTGLVTDHFGPTVEFLTSPEDEHSDFCVLKGTIPPGAAVPLHAHADTEDFLLISGSMEGLRQDAQGYTWISVSAGDYVHVPGDAHHAWRNRSSEPAVSLIITTRRMARFFQETGRPLASAAQPVAPEELARFAAIAASYGHWLATPEENAAVGIDVSF